MSEEIIDAMIKTPIINILIYIVFYRINGEKVNAKIAIIGATTQSICYIFMKIMLNNNFLVMILFSYCVQIFFMKMCTKDKRKSIITSGIISNVIVYVVFLISLLIELIPKQILKINNQTIDMILTLLLENILIFIFINMKRIRKGISFLKDPMENEYLCIIMMSISSVTIFAYCMFGSSDEYWVNNTFFVILTLFIIMIVLIQKTITLYYKQKLLAQNIEEYKAEIASKDAEIKSLSEEKYKISKLNHEFYNRQKALIHKVEEITNMNTETAEELDLSKQINDLTKEYTDKAKEIKTLDKLPITGITEIDDMFKYMQSECKSKNIQFNLQINGNIYHMINNKIAQNKLVTMIGDHLRDAIIAIEFSENSFKSILAILGENNGLYEFCVFDTGIEFKIDTLLKLGLEPATTHKDSGGTGIGFMTTFETMSETKASLIINEMHEMNNTDYTKSITIRFDGKNEYRIKSYRSDEIKKKLKDNRIIIEN